jgi:hypothetical protein
MRKHREQRTLRLRRETLRSLTDRALARVAGGSWGVDPTWDEGEPSANCWSGDPQSYSTGSRFC